MTWSEVIGQEEAKERLMQMVREDRLPHAMMLCGPVGSGKLALAIAFGCYLLSRSEEGGTRKENSSSAEGNLVPPSSFLVPRHIQAMLDKLEHPDLHFTYPTIKLSSMKSDYKPVSDDFAKEWHELVMQSPYFTMEEWMEAMGGE